MPDPNRVAQDLFDALPDRYDLLAEVLSFGQNRRWRRAMCDRVVATRPALVLDVASGTAGVSIQLADRSPAHVVGIDLTEQMLRRGQGNVARAGFAARVSLTVGHAEQLPFRDATFDGLTFTYLLRYVADPKRPSRNWSAWSNPARPSPISSSSCRRTASGERGGCTPVSCCRLVAG
jgi:demethylmenaquinone methyltransferase/2-methoxy-6-polyprenyl-1,4-benzoquinol methylase